jgi:hypothetical protein
MGWEPHQKDLVLILARDMAARLALLGQSFAGTGEVAPEQWAGTFVSVHPDGTPIPWDELPLGIALMKGRPAHREVDLRAPDGVTRRLAATAIPLQRHPGQTVGAVAMFWERSTSDPGTGERSAPAPGGNASG